MFRVTASTYENETGINCLRFSKRFQTQEAAEACAAMFPKYAKMRATKVHSLTNPFFVTETMISFVAITGNPANETGIKRARKIFELIGNDFEVINDAAQSATIDKILEFLN